MVNSSTWQDRFEQLATWSVIYGHCRVPKAEGALGRWVARQRELWKGDKLEQSRVAMLDSIGFTWKVIASAWNEKYNMLADYKEIHGHTNVPISNELLGSWVSKQRQSRKRGKLSKEKVALLSKLNFTWSTSDSDWEEKFQRLVAWINHHGHANVPFNEGGLGWWTNTQRQSKRKGKLCKHREKLLNQLGFVWNPSISKKRMLKRPNGNRNEADQSLEKTPAPISHIPAPSSQVDDLVSNINSERSDWEGDGAFMSPSSPRTLECNVPESTSCDHARSSPLEPIENALRCAADFPPSVPSCASSVSQKPCMPSPLLGESFGADSLFLHPALGSVTVPPCPFSQDRKLEALPTEIFCDSLIL